MLVLKTEIDKWLDSDWNRITFFKWEANQPGKDAPYACCHRGLGTWLATNGDLALDVFCVKDKKSSSTAENYLFNRTMNRLDYTKEEYLDNLAVNYTISLAKFNQTYFTKRYGEIQSYLERLKINVTENTSNSKRRTNPVEKSSVALKMIAAVVVIPFWLFVLCFMYKLLKITSKKYQRDKKTKEGVD